MRVYTVPSLKSYVELTANTCSNLTTNTQLHSSEAGYILPAKP